MNVMKKLRRLRIQSCTQTRMMMKVKITIKLKVKLNFKLFYINLVLLRMRLAAVLEWAKAANHVRSSKYISNRKIQKSKSSNSAIAAGINSQNTHIYITLGANMHPEEHFNNDTAMALISLSTNVPRSYKQSTSPEQLGTFYPEIDKEHDSLLRNKTWKLVKRETGMSVLPSK